MFMGKILTELVISPFRSLGRSLEKRRAHYCREQKNPASILRKRGFGLRFTPLEALKITPLKGLIYFKPSASSILKPSSSPY